MEKSLRKLLGTGNKVPGMFDGIGKKIDGFRKRITNLALSAFVFNVIRRSLRRLSDYMGKMLTSNKQFSASLAGIKANLSSAFAPIYSSILPAINALMSALQAVTAWLARFTAMIFGSASSGAKNLAKEIGGVGGAAKKARKELAAFDEIHVLNQDDGGAGGGGGAGSGAVFEDASIEFSGFMQDLLDAIGAGDWLLVGEMLAQKINAMIHGIDWAGVGRKIGGFLQSAFLFGYGFLNKVDTAFLGAGLSRTINKIFTALDSNLVGATIAQFFNRIVDFVCGFVTELNWKDIGDWIVKAINGFVEAFDSKRYVMTIILFVAGIVGMLLTVIQGIRWESLANTFAEGINQLIRGVNWMDIILAIAGLVGGIVLFIKTFIQGVDWIELTKVFTNGLVTLLGSVDMFELAATAAVLVNTIFNMIQAFFSTVDWIKLGTDLAAWIMAAIESIDFETVGSAVNGALSSLLNFVLAFVGGLDWGKIGDAIGVLFLSIDWNDAAEKILKIIIRVIEGAGEAIWNAFQVAIGIRDPKPMSVEEYEMHIARMSIEVASIDEVKMPEMPKQVDEFGEKIPVSVAEGARSAHDSLDKYLRNELIPSGAMIDAAIKERAEEMGYNVPEGFQAGIEDRQAYLRAYIAEEFAGGISDEFAKALGINSPSTVFNDFAGNILDGLLYGFVAGVGHVLNWLRGSLIGPIAIDFAMLTDSIPVLFRAAWEGVKDAWGHAKEWFASAVINPLKSAFMALPGAILQAVNGTIAIANAAIFGIESSINKIVRGVNALGNGVPGGLGMNLPAISLDRIPLLATGAVIPPNAEFMAVLGDQKRGMNIEAPEDLIRKIVREETENARQGAQEVHIHFDGDLAGLARLLRPVLRQEDGRVGSSFVLGGDYA